MRTRVCWMRTGITIDWNARDRQQLAAGVADRNSPQKHVWRARIVLLTSDGCGTAEVMRLTDTAKTTVWRWQEPRVDAVFGVDGPARAGAAPGPEIQRAEEEVVPSSQIAAIGCLCCLRRTRRT